MKIISISGRKGSGKSELSKLLVDRGFKKVSFADTLKFLVCTVYKWDLSKIGELEYKESILPFPVKWDEEMARELEVAGGLPKGSLWVECREFKTRREALQYVGTEVLRRYDTNFHVNSLVSRLHPDENYVMDDTRFPNELQALKDIGAICLFVIRPNNFEYSNHASEISVTRKDFDHVLLNDKSKEALIKSGEWFFSTVLSKNPPKITKSQLISYLNGYESTESAARALGCSRDKLVWWARKHLVRLEDRNYQCNEDAFSIATPEASYWAGYLSADGCLKNSGVSKTSLVLDLGSIDLDVIENFRVFLGSDKPIYTRKNGPGSYPSTRPFYYFIAHSSYLLDDLKLWNLHPNKGVYNELPAIAIHNEECMKAWYIGLIDGDGSIFRRGGDDLLIISFLGSLEVLSYLKDWANLPGKILQEKEVEGLFNFRVTGTRAFDFANWLNPSRIGLKRKWDKLIQLSSTSSSVSPASQSLKVANPRIGQPHNHQIGSHANSQTHQWRGE